MAMKKNNKQTVHKPIDRRARMIDVMLRKLETNPHTRPEKILNFEEFNEALLMIRTAVAFVHGYMAEQRYKGRRVKPPSSFNWHGRMYPLLYGMFLGQVFIANKSGKGLIGSGYNVI